MHAIIISKKLLSFVKQVKKKAQKEQEEMISVKEIIEVCLFSRFFFTNRVKR